jgi:spoIIIJ-associated protein
VSQRDNAVAEPSGSARDHDAGERDVTPDPEELSAVAPDDSSVAGEPGRPAGQAAESAADAAAAGATADAAPGPGMADAGDDAAAPELDGETGLRDDDGDDDGDRDEDVADLELEGEIAADYVEGLLDVADLDGDIDMDVEGDRALVSVVGATLDELVGPRGEVLEALQELTRLAVHRQTGVRTRIMLDVGGYRLRRRAELAEAGREAAEEVRETGVPKKMWAMNRFERKVVHDAIAAAGLRSESEGEEPDRRVVVLPAE